MVIRADIDRLAPSRSQARQLGLADAARENQFRQGLIQQGGKDLNQIADFMDRRDILNQLGAQQEQLGVQPVQQPQVDIETQTDAILESGGIVDEETEANFSSLAEKTEGASDADMQKEIINHAQKGLAEGRDMSDTIELAGKSPQEQRLAIGNINEMIKNKSVRRMMARNPEGAQSFLKGLGATGMDGGASKVQFGAQQTIKDSEGNLFTITQKRDPRTGQVETAYAPIGDAPPRPVGDTEITGAYGFTGQETVGFESDKARDKLRQGAIERGAQTTYENVSKIDASISTIDDALDALDDGAQVGALSEYLPSFRASTKRFNSARNRMGLDVVASVTFGALSKGELDVAMATAMPKGLNEVQARKFLEDKKAAQIKLRNFYLEMADRSVTEGKTPAEIMIDEAKKRKNKPKSTPKPQTKNQPKQEDPLGLF